ncbi:hypothetical protein [Azonexus sp.]|jgi:hypothetical protein|uniref:hypothetical protein n=1 Tax=Azonexus sp. TaxID=1872668 RepID=UPI00282EAFAB|nr:hypothetical protein [Azonexus sp.]MDR1994814.1 hypothetical protein [Azonexus sp.]
MYGIAPSVLAHIGQFLRRNELFQWSVVSLVSGIGERVDVRPALRPQWAVGIAGEDADNEKESVCRACRVLNRIVLLGIGVFVACSGRSWGVRQVDGSELVHERL